MYVDFGSRDLSINSCADFFCVTNCLDMVESFGIFTGILPNFALEIDCASILKII